MGLHDRRMTVVDEKKRILDFEKDSIPDSALPDIDVHDEPFLYYKMHIAWRSIIFTWLQLLASVAGFFDAQDEGHVGIQQVYKFMTPVDVPDPATSLESFGNCTIYDTRHNAVSFYPNDPFLSAEYTPVVVHLKWIRFKDLITPGFLPEWLQFAIDVLGDKTGYHDNDVFLALDTQDVFGWSVVSEFLSAIVDINFLPSMTIKTTGSGVVQLKFLLVPLGGSVIIWWDIQPTWQQILDVINGELFSNFTLIELNRDLTAFPPELAPSTLTEIVFEEEGEHSIFCLFFPRFNDELPFVFPFGGFREIRVCGDMEVISIDGTKTIDIDDMRQGVIPVATTEEICEGMVCAFETVAKRILLSKDLRNLVSGVEISEEDGEVTVKQPAGYLDATKKLEQEHTPAQEVRYGAALYQAQQLAKMFNDANTNNTNGVGDNTITRIAASFIDFVGDLATSTFYEYFTGYLGHSQLNTSIPDLAGYIFCADDFYTGAIDYVQNELVDENFDETNVNDFLNIISEIPNTTVARWYREGAITPRTGYTSLPCATIDDQTVILTTAILAVPAQLPTYITTVQAPNRLKRLLVTGKIIDTGDGDAYDGVYFISNTGVKTYIPPILHTASLGSFAALSQPPYSPTGGYALEYRITANSYVDAIWWYNASHASKYASINPASGQVSYTLVDVGKE